MDRAPSIKIEKAYKVQDSCCYYCKTKVPYGQITRDHIKPAKDGNVLKDNYVFSCRRCNSYKGSDSLEYYIDLNVEKIVNTLRIIKNNGFIATQSQVDYIRYLHKVMLSVQVLIANDYKSPYAK